MQIATVAVALVGLMASRAAVAEANGNQLLTQCQQAVRAIDNVSKPSDNGVDAGQCFGVVNGVMFMMDYLSDDLSNDHKACFPKDGITNWQAVRIVEKFLKENPSILHLEGPFLTMAAFHEAYPCK